jgi:hypothetical protein
VISSGARPAVLSFLLALPAVGVALADNHDQPRRANLDADPYIERVIPQELCEATDGTLHLPQPECAADQFPRRRILVEDVCAAAPYIHRISTVQDYVDQFNVLELDGATERPEIFFTIRSGASGRGGEVRIVRYGESRGDCPKARWLFRYPIKSTLGRIPRGAVGRVSFYASARDLRKRHPGKEVRLVETYVDRDDAFCCPSFRRVSFFRFDRGRDQYLRYRTRVRRIRSARRGGASRLAPSASEIP